MFCAIGVGCRSLEWERGNGPRPANGEWGRAGPAREVVGAGIGRGGLRGGIDGGEVRTEFGMVFSLLPWEASTPILSP